MKYSGRLGTFDYDESMYEIGINERGEDYMHYVGGETDGAKISVPNGLVIGDGLFEYTGIQSQPVLPRTLKNMNYMFIGCDNLSQAGAIPEGVTEAASAYSYTPITNVPAMPESLSNANFMFDGCTRIKTVESLPSNLKNADCMFANCIGLENMCDIPDSVSSKKSVFLNCDKLPMEFLIDNDEDYIYDAETSYDDMFDDLSEETDITKSIDGFEINTNGFLKSYIQTKDAPEVHQTKRRDLEYMNEYPDEQPSDDFQFNLH